MPKVSRDLTINEALGIALQERRIKKEMTPSRLAQLLSIPETTILAIENGRRPATVEALYEICKVLNCRPLSVIEYADQLFERRPVKGYKEYNELMDTIEKAWRGQNYSLVQLSDRAGENMMTIKFTLLRHINPRLITYAKLMVALGVDPLTVLKKKKKLT